MTLLRGGKILKGTKFKINECFNGVVHRTYVFKKHAVLIDFLLQPNRPWA